MNDKLTLSAVIEATGGQIWSSTGSVRADRPPFPSSSGSNRTVLTAERTLTFENVTYDSREVVPGSLFVALPGETSDGHRYLAQAVERGAAGCLVRREWVDQQAELPAQVAWIAVEDTLPAFQRLGAYWRDQFLALKVVGITGSVGKTSTKELLSAVLGQRFRVFKSPKSVNTEQSILPLLFKLQPDDQIAVLEMGAGYALGELTRLCRVTRPLIGVELGVSHSHFGRMGSLDNIARNKAELVASLPAAAEGGVAVLNGDDERVRAMAALTEARPFLYGINPAFDLWADGIESFGLAGIAFVAHYRGEAHPLRLPLLGRHSVYTALAAIAVSLVSDLGWDEIEAGLNAPGTQVRLQVGPGLNGSTIIDDSYNASPVSTVAALDLLDDTRPTGGGRKLAVLGDMLELGSYEQEAHEIVGRRAAHVVDWLLVVGSLAQTVGQTALATGLSPDRVIFAPDKAAVVEWLQTHLQADDLLLVKASRGAALEEIVEKVRANQ